MFREWPLITRKRLLGLVCRVHQRANEADDQLGKESKRVGNGVDENSQDQLNRGEDDAANRVEHYEMAAYGTARTFAEMLGYNEAAQMLEQTLQEEKQADRKLTELAEQMVNENALEVGALK